MAIDRIADYRILPPARGRRERDNKKDAKRQREPSPPPKEHQIDERA
jgi:hypothetical protein